MPAPCGRHTAAGTGAYARGYPGGGRFVLAPARRKTNAALAAPADLARCWEAISARACLTRAFSTVGTSQHVDVVTALACRVGAALYRPGPRSCCLWVLLVLGGSAGLRPH